MERINNYTSIQQITGKYLNQNAAPNSPVAGKQVSFEDILNKQRSIAEVLDDTKSHGLKFSKHADNRLAQRNISLTDEQMKRLEDGTDKAQAKGIKESLVILDNYSFIVNTNNRTVITAMDQNFGDDNIYTNIDGAVII